ncbi:DotU family type IV/VI secretion system protein, partial [Burkholderia pseudomallei]|nr:DotU family type IV/VI secretion system protein [Burkholderia pseudomallei]
HALADARVSEARPTPGKKAVETAEVWKDGGAANEAAHGRSWRIVGGLLAFAALMTMWLVIDTRLSHEVEQMEVTSGDEAAIHPASGD